MFGAMADNKAQSLPPPPTTTTATPGPPTLPVSPVSPFPAIASSFLAPLSSPLASQPPSSSSSTAAERRPASKLVRRPSSQARLDAILETARRRAETATALPMSPLFRSASEHEGGVDETTGMVGAARDGGDHRNYMSTATMDASGSGAAAVPAGPRERRPAGASPLRRQSGGGSGSRSSRHRPESTNSHASWWRLVWANMQSMELENKGSVARDHLALERTFLAWLRTSLSFASIGIAVTQLFRLNTSAADSGSDGGSGDSPAQEADRLASLRRVGRPLGATFLGLSILVLFLGYHRYYQSQQWILRGKFPASRGTILLLTLVTLALMVASLVVVVVLHAPHGS